MAPEDLCGLFNMHILIGLRLKPLKSEMNIFFFLHPQYNSSVLCMEIHSLMLVAKQGWCACSRLYIQCIVVL